MKKRLHHNVTNGSGSSNDVEEQPVEAQPMEAELDPYKVIIYIHPCC